MVMNPQSMPGSNGTVTYLSRLWQVIFVGEEAVDAGGVRKEFFLLIMKELLDPKYGMFRYYEESRLIWFSNKVLALNQAASLCDLCETLPRLNADNHWLSLADIWGHWLVQPHRGHLRSGHLQSHHRWAQLPLGPLQEASEEEANARRPERANARCGKVRSRNSHLRFPFNMFMNGSLPWHCLNFT